MITLKVLFAIFTAYSGCYGAHSFYELKGGNVDRIVVPYASSGNSPSYIWKLSDNVSEADYLSACPLGHRVDSIS